jgi:NADH dehydrogenase [ubiquinone] 1 alpha subcomplex assembly factor 1
MGGCSTSCLRYDTMGHAVFEGTVKPDNNGGFASVRTHAADLGVKGASAYGLKINSDGKRYKFNLRMEDRFDGVTYQAAFVTPAGVWTTLHLPLSQFTATFRGRAVPDAPSLDTAMVRQAGFMIADRQMGDFSLKVQAIGTL